MSAQKLSTYQKVRAGVWATGIGIIVMAGTWYGAGLKEQKQFEEVLHPFPLTYFLDSSSHPPSHLYAFPPQPLLPLHLTPFNPIPPLPTLLPYPIPSEDLTQDNRRRK